MGEFAIEVDREAVAAACQRYGVRRLDLFGSIVTDAFDEGRSDVDVVVDFLDQNFVGLADRYFGLQATLAQIFNRPVDLLTERSIRNPYLRRQIDAERREVFRAA